MSAHLLPANALPPQGCSMLGVTLQRALWLAAGVLLPGWSMAQGEPPPAPGPMEPAPLPHLEDLTLPVEAITIPVWLVALLVLGGLLVLGLLLWLIIALLRRQPQAVVHPIDRAQAALRHLREQAATLAPSETAHSISVILRQYQLEAYGVPAPYRSTEEIYPKNRPGPIFRERFAPLAEIYDRLEFAPEPATTTAADVLILRAIDALEAEKKGPSAPRIAQPPPLPPEATSLAPDTTPQPPAPVPPPLPASQS